MFKLFDKLTPIDYFSFSERAICLTHEVIKYSSTQLTDEELNTVFGKEILRKIDVMRSEFIPYPEYSRDWIEFIANSARHYGVGNCCEKSCYAFRYLSHQKELLSVNLELFNTPFRDHFFVVLGRDILTNTSDPSTWNEDCVICDTFEATNSYFIRDVAFDSLATNSYRVIDDLLYEKFNKKQHLVLKQNILVSFNDEITSEIHSQDSLVLRARYYDGQFEVFNTDIPMCYEEWDFPSNTI